MKIDRIEVIRGAVLFPEILKNGDQLDSLAEFYEGPIRRFFSDKVNTDPTVGWAGTKGGILAESEYQKEQLRFLCDYRADNGKKVLFIYKATDERNKSIVLAKDLTVADRTLVSLIPNFAHNGLNEIDAVLFHAIGSESDGSHGCLSADGFRAIISHFEIGDKGLFNLKRSPNWKPREEYRLAGRVA